MTGVRFANHETRERHEIEPTTDFSDGHGFLMEHWNATPAPPGAGYTDWLNHDPCPSVKSVVGSISCRSCVSWFKPIGLLRRGSDGRIAGDVHAAGSDAEQFHFIGQCARADSEDFCSFSPVARYTREGLAN